MQTLDACLADFVLAFLSEFVLNVPAFLKMGPIMDAMLGLPFDLCPPFRTERPEGSGTFVRLADDAKKCVVYLGIPTINEDVEMTPIGTGFLVAHEGGTYIVTAAHVAHDLDDVAFGVRLNNELGEGRIDRIDKGAWKYHPTGTVDVAVLEYEIPDWADANPFRKWFATDFKRTTKDFGAGDMAYVVGVYKFLHGKKRNMPAVHTGFIAAMGDDEEIPIADWRVPEALRDKAPLISVYGHLMQVPTLPASSGSPVFIRRSLRENQPYPEIPAKMKAWMYGSVWLLGLWQGAWGDVTRMISLPDGTVDIGTGMGVVVPAVRILEALDHPDLVASREAKKQTRDRPMALKTQSDKATLSKGGALFKSLLNTPPATKKAKASKKAG